MIEVSESPGKTTVSLGGANAPDWSLVPFEVGCARCGHDLRGLSEPKCPACGLEFTWADALPLEELICPGCAYHLIGLTQTRCPECGRPFTWDEVLSAASRRCVPLFEYHWRDHPLTSLLSTWRRQLRPRRFWSTLDIHDVPQPQPLVSMAVLALFAFVAAGVLLYPTYYSVVRWLHQGGRFSWGRWAWRVQKAWEYELSGGIMSLVLAWCLTSLAALFVFRWSMRRYQVRRVQVFRVWAYAVPIFPLAVAALSWLLFALRFISWQIGTPRVTDLERDYPLFASILGIGLVVWSLREAYTRYLRMPRAGAVAVASQVMAVMAALVLWEMAFRGNAGRIIHYGLTLGGRISAG